MAVVNRDVLRVDSISNTMDIEDVVYKKANYLSNFFLFYTTSKYFRYVRLNKILLKLFTVIKME